MVSKTAFHVHLFAVDYIKLKLNLSDHMRFLRENTMNIVYEK